MGTKAVEITIARLTYKTVSDVLDTLRKADAAAWRTAMAGLDRQTCRILKMRADLKQHPTRENVAQILGLSVDTVRHAETWGLAALCVLFSAASGRQVIVNKP